MPLLLLYFLSALSTAFFLVVWSEAYNLHLLLSYVSWTVFFVLLCGRRERYSLPVLLLLAFAVRLLFLFVPDILTGDLPRYLWEGYLVREGINPYLYAPDDPSLSSLRTEYWHTIEYPHLSAIYPPVAQYFLSLFAWSTFGWRLFLFCIEILNAFLLIRLLERYQLSKHQSCFYILLPLPVLEIVGAGHLEGLLVVFLLLAFLVEGVVAQAIFFAAGTLVKYVVGLPGAIVGVLLLLKKEYGKAFLLGSTYLLSLLLFSLPLLDTELHIFRSLQQYVAHWRFNDSLFFLIGQMFSVDWSDLRTFGWIRYLLAALWGVFVVSCFFRTKSVMKITLYAFVFYLLQSSVFHPWYGLWFAPLICFVPSRAAIYLLLSLPLSYVARFTEAEMVPLWVLVLEFAPVYLLLIFETFREAAEPSTA